MRATRRSFCRSPGGFNPKTRTANQSGTGEARRADSSFANFVRFGGRPASKQQVVHTGRANRPERSPDFAPPRHTAARVVDARTMALAPGLARKVKKVLETRVDDPEIVPCLKTLSDFYPENTPAARRGARAI